MLVCERRRMELNLRLRQPAMLHKKKTLAGGCSTILQFYFLFSSHFLFCSILKLSETKFLCCCSNFELHTVAAARATSVAAAVAVVFLVLNI